MFSKEDDLNIVIDSSTRRLYEEVSPQEDETMLED
jgi:hypothetical protein